MDNLENQIRALTEQLAQSAIQMNQSFAQMNQKFDHMETRLGTLKKVHGPHTKPDLESPPHPRRAPAHDPFIEANPRRPPRHDPYFKAEPRRPPHRDRVLEVHPRRPNQEFMDQEERAIRNLRLKAPTFDGNLHPKDYIDWEVDMDNYFKWDELFEDEKVRFAQMQLGGQAKSYWCNDCAASQDSGSSCIH